MIGQVLQALCCRGMNAVAHMALLFDHLDPEDAALAHKHGLHDASVPHVFEVLNDTSRPSFRTLSSSPWSDTSRIRMHDVVRSPAPDETVDVYVRNVFLACVRICEGDFEYRWGPHCNLACPCLCCDCTHLCVPRGTLGLSPLLGREGNCVSVLLLALALGVDPTVDTSYEIVKTLGLNETRPRCSGCRHSAILATYGPPEVFRALQHTGVLAVAVQRVRRTPLRRTSLARDPTEGLW